ncbi:hypothetical protein V6N13_034977 [Hibiscus sabdariffa]|uniref:Uncharacterized protein n=1 Tax=Hibiscus sabdariffa TaxID=183260 RepID=A0ABR2AY79_9ROSI
MRSFEPGGKVQLFTQPYTTRLYNRELLDAVPYIFFFIFKWMRSGLNQFRIKEMTLAIVGLKLHSWPLALSQQLNSWKKCHTSRAQPKHSAFPYETLASLTF